MGTAQFCALLLHRKMAQGKVVKIGRVAASYYLPFWANINLLKFERVQWRTFCPDTGANAPKMGIRYCTLFMASQISLLIPRLPSPEGG